jgi:type IV pilus assembly protein PilE
MKKYTGFSLIELVVAMAIMAILVAVAYPSYTSYVQKNRRSDGQVALMDLANRMDRYFTENNSYAGATLTNVSMPATSPQGYYNLSITSATASAFTIQAAPTGAQAGDTTCGTLTLNQLGQKGKTGTAAVADCW